MSARAFLMTILAVSLTFSLGVPVMAGGSKPAAAKPAKKAPTLIAPDNTPVNSAKKDLEDANTGYSKAKSALDEVVVNIRRDFEKSETHKSAADAVKQAQAAFDAAREPVLNALQDKPEYIAAKTDKEKAQKAQETLGDSATPEQRTESAKAVMQAGNTVTKLEGEAIEADPKAKDAKAKLAEAAAKLGQITRDFDASVKNDGSFTSAKSNVEQAKSKQDQAEAYLKSAEEKHQKAQADYDRQQKAMADAKKAAADAKKAADAKAKTPKN